ncbi:zupT [Symbiodinium necroappetens]|uniref:ZupT protein n=1 Tax=Symbiodinium necroappetens TaxID=1628268 RepID=A0A812TB61_9DINO|nr:zupT [Symbiodinium necroappetens]
MLAGENPAVGGGRASQKNKARPPGVAVRSALRDAVRRPRLVFAMLHRRVRSVGLGDECTVIVSGDGGREHEEDPLMPGFASVATSDMSKASGMEFPRDLPDLEALETPAENSREEEEEGVCTQKEQEAPVPHETVQQYVPEQGDALLLVSIPHGAFLTWLARAREAVAALDWTATEERFPTESALDSVRRLRKELPPKPIVCILGGTAISKPDTEETVKELADALSARVGSRAVFMTGGMAGVQKAFADSCPEHMPLFHLTPFGEKSNFDMGQDVHAGVSLAERKDVYGLLGDLYITIEGGPGVAGEAKAAAERGAAVIPLIRSGGASAGMFDFPTGALNKPAWALEAQWALLSKEVAPACREDL